MLSVTNKAPWGWIWNKVKISLSNDKSSENEFIGWITKHVDFLILSLSQGGLLAIILYISPKVSYCNSTNGAWANLFNWFIIELSGEDIDGSAIL